ncbi:MAG: hypothetical protein ACI9TH_001080 [Kiritimatiellia bacterium]|jgi:hypothetical protein
MKRLLIVLPLIFVFLGVSGCVHPARKLNRLELGMTEEDVLDQMGKPYSVRAAKLFKDEETTEIWEFWPPFMAINDQKIHVIFENERVVQWGVAGDFTTGTERNVKEYNQKKPGG